MSFGKPKDHLAWLTRLRCLLRKIRLAARWPLRRTATDGEGESPLRRPMFADAEGPDARAHWSGCCPLGWPTAAQGR